MDYKINSLGTEQFGEFGLSNVLNRYEASVKADGRLYLFSSRLFEEDNQDSVEVRGFAANQSGENHYSLQKLVYKKYIEPTEDNFREAIHSYFSNYERFESLEFPDE